MKKRLVVLTSAVLAASAFGSAAAPTAEAGVVCQAAGNAIYKYVGPLAVRTGLEHEVGLVCSVTP